MGCFGIGLVLPINPVTYCSSWIDFVYLDVALLICVRNIVDPMPGFEMAGYALSLS